jgi:hypothetical protein
VRGPIRRGLVVDDARPLPLAEPVRDARGRLRRAVDGDRQEEGPVVRDIEHPVDGEVPLAAEVALAAGLGRGRDHRDEQRALADLPADRRVPRGAAAQFAAVEPDFGARGAQRPGEAGGRIGVLRRIAQEDRVRGLAHCVAYGVPVRPGGS